jgi:hypothetical protein
MLFNMLCTERYSCIAIIAAAVVYLEQGYTHTRADVINHVHCAVLTGLYEEAPQHSAREERSGAAGNCHICNCHV